MGIDLRYVDNIKNDFQDMGCEYTLDSTGSG